MDDREISVFPYKVPRIGQLDLIKAILSYSEKTSIINIRAPTGFGKTVAVLYSATKIVERGIVDKILYVVRTRNELDPVIKEAKNIGINFTVVYSGRRMCPYALNKAISNEGFWLFCSILRIQGRCQYYSKALKTSIDSIKNVVNLLDDHFTIAKTLSSRTGICPYFSLLMLSEHVPLTIATYPYLFKEHILLTTFSHLDPTKTLLIIDEAHNIINIGGIMGDSIDINIVESSINEILEHHHDVQEVVEFLHRLAMVRISGRGFRFIGKNSIGLEKSVVERISSIASDIAMRTVLDIGNSIDKAMEKDLKIVYTSKFLETLSKEYFELFGLATHNGKIELHVLPISFNPLRKLIEQFKLTIMMSGTPPSNKFLRQLAAIQKDITSIDVEEFGAPNYIHKNTYVVIFTSATTSYTARSESMYKVYAKLINEIYNSSRKWIVMAVYPSYEVMLNILKYLTSSNNSIVDSGEPLSIIKNILLTKDSAILHTVAGGRLTEGIELIKNGESMIKCIVIIGIPYPQPDDYIEMILRNTRGGEPYIDYYMEVATTRIIQAIGRAIRSENDYALIILADKRYRNPSIIKMLKLNIKRIATSVTEIGNIVEQFYNQLQFK